MNDVLYISLYIFQVSIGIVLGVACAGKIRDVAAFTGVINEYRIANTRLAAPIAVCVIVSEAFASVSLVLSWLVPLGLSVALLLFAVFIIGIGINLRRGRMIRCGCFTKDEVISRSSYARAWLLFAGSLLCSFTNQVYMRSDSVDRLTSDLLGRLYLILIACGLLMLLLLLARCATMIKLLRSSYNS